MPQASCAPPDFTQCCSRNQPKQSHDALGGKMAGRKSHGGEKVREVPSVGRSRREGFTDSALKQGPKSGLLQ